MEKKISKIEASLEPYYDLLPQPESFDVAVYLERASNFLTAMAHISRFVHDFEGEKIKVSSLERVRYRDVMFQEGGNDDKITAKKIRAEADPTYLEIKEELEIIESHLKWLSTQYKLFENAHVLYRQQSKTL